VLADVPQSALAEVWRELDALGSRPPNIGTLTDMICCPGLDFCSLANAGSIDVAKQIHARFDDLDYLYDLGPIEIKMSGCMNACGHHHIGHIGILGVDKHGKEWYQITIGGSSAAPAALGEVIGPSVPKEQVAETIARLLEVYLRGAPSGRMSALSTRCGASASNRSRSGCMRRIIRRRELVTDDCAMPASRGSRHAYRCSRWANSSRRSVPAAPLPPASPRRCCGGASAVLLAPTDEVEALAPHLGLLELIVVEFPKIGEGRGFSQARLLRQRYGYARRTARTRRAQARPAVLPGALRLRQLRPRSGGGSEAALGALDTFSVAYQEGSDELVHVQRRVKPGLIGWPDRAFV
jgi:hypothetical protein